MKSRLAAFLALAGILALVLAAPTGGSMAQTPQELFEGTVDAPEFPEGLDWLNVAAPLTMDGLRGKIVLFDFWTYGCINCIHMIPVLEHLEEKYPNELVIIGVHSAKFQNEGQTENIRQIVKRYNLRHPVINDHEFIVWRTYGVRAWPTFAIVDPRGRVAAIQAGEIPFVAFDRYLSGMIEYYDGLGQNDINREPLEIALEGAGDPGTPLLFPGKVKVDSAGNRLFIADSNHHRIVIADLTTYAVLAVVGSGKRGFDDGDYATATFNQPQGMALKDNRLYVADVNNHAIRVVDLDKKTVSTIAGTGSMGRGLTPFDLVLNNPRSSDLRSPWDVAFGADDMLYIAMAGTHQIWQFNLKDNILRPAIGSGREAQFNATLRESDLAQPGGLYYTDGRLYFADSESSTVRVADFGDNSVRVIAGTLDNNLFDSGDVDGPRGTNRLQHALGVTGDEKGFIYIADTYNSKIKRYDPATEETKTLFGLGGAGGFRDGDAATAQFDEPGGLDYAVGKLYVADTNNHAIRVIDLAAGMVSTVVFPNPEALQIDRSAVTLIGGNVAAGEILTLEAQTVAAGEGALTLNFTIPAGYKLNPLITSTVVINSVEDPFTFTQDTYPIEGAEVTIPVTFSAGAGTLHLEITLYYCEAEKQEFCLVDDFKVTAPVTVTADGSNKAIVIEREVVVPQVYRNSN